MPIWYVAQMTESDIDEILQIERASFYDPWTYTLFLSELQNDHSYSNTIHCFDFKSNTIIAYICSRLIIDEIHIYRIAVETKWRRQGVASWLLERTIQKALEEGAVSSYLEVRSSNLPAMAFYDKIGFRMIGERKGYYRETGDNALILKKELILKEGK